MSRWVVQLLHTIPSFCNDHIFANNDCPYWYFILFESRSIFEASAIGWMCLRLNKKAIPLGEGMAGGGRAMK